MKSVTKRKYDGIKTTLTITEISNSVEIMFETKFSKGEAIKTSGLRLSPKGCDLLIDQLSAMRTAMKTRELLGK